jgi:hypothetical protein
MLSTVGLGAFSGIILQKYSGTAREADVSRLE